MAGRASALVTVTGRWVLLAAAVTAAVALAMTVAAIRRPGRRPGQRVQRDGW